MISWRKNNEENIVKAIFDFKNFNLFNEITRAAGFHTDENNDRLCDTCNAELESKGLSGGAISGIAVGSLTFVGISGFSLFWFVIKKKSWAAPLKLLLG